MSGTEEEKKLYPDLPQFRGKTQEQIVEQNRINGMKGGRPPGPSKLNDQFIHDYCLLVKTGMPPNRACEELNVAYGSFKKWKLQGKRDLDKGITASVHARLAQQAPAAENKLLKKALSRVVDDIESYDSPTSASTAKWVLQTRDPENWGPPKQRTEHLSVSVQYSHMSTEELVKSVIGSLDRGGHGAVIDVQESEVDDLLLSAGEEENEDD